MHKKGGECDCDLGMKYTIEEKRYGVGIVAPGLPAVLVMLGRQTALEPGSLVHILALMLQSEGKRRMGSELLSAVMLMRTVSL